MLKEDFEEIKKIYEMQMSADRRTIELNVTSFEKLLNQAEKSFDDSERVWHCSQCDAPHTI